VVEHDMNFVMEVCDDVMVLDFGKMIAAGPPEEIRDNPAVIAAYLGDEIDADIRDTTIELAAPAPAPTPGGGA